jgi:hypothetical protein
MFVPVARVRERVAPDVWANTRWSRPSGCPGERQDGAQCVQADCIAVCMRIRQAIVRMKESQRVSV